MCVCACVIPESSSSDDKEKREERGLEMATAAASDLNVGPARFPFISLPCQIVAASESKFGLRSKPMERGRERIEHKAHESSHICIYIYILLYTCYTLQHHQQDAKRWIVFSNTSKQGSGAAATSNSLPFYSYIFIEREREMRVLLRGAGGRRTDPLAFSTRGARCGRMALYVHRCDKINELNRMKSENRLALG